MIEEQSDLLLLTFDLRYGSAPSDNKSFTQFKRLLAVATISGEIPS